METRKLTDLFVELFESEKTGGLLLFGCTIISLLLTNELLPEIYPQWWQTKVGGHSLTHWINDGLMAIFFLLIGLELEREIYSGELSSLKSASLPIFAALGGMVVPATAYLAFNRGTPTQSGAGIAMATDIAFAIGILSLLGSRVPASLKVFLTALAVIDDLGAILIIATFYTTSLSLTNLGLAIGIFFLLLAFNRMGLKQLWIYLAGGVAMWYFMLHSGVHATITGVLLAFTIPYGDGSSTSPSYKLQHRLHKPVALLILPVFALANTCIPVEGNWQDAIKEAHSIGIISGLVLGKPIGVLLFSFVAFTAGWASLPDDMNWHHVIGIGCLAGIGFTMSIFISMLAFNDALIITQSKISILLASQFSGLVGYVWLYFTLRKSTADSTVR